MGQYDTTTKHLIQAHPRDWLALAGFPAASGDTVSAVDADLSSITTAPDQLIRVDGESPYLAHVEFQSGSDARLDRRVLLYNVLAGWRHRLPVRSVAFLLRPEAMPAGVTGTVRESLPPNCRLDFAYELIRVWTIPRESLVEGGLGTLPLAVVSNIGETDLPDVIDRMRKRLSTEAPRTIRAELWTATRILMGLRYTRPLIEQLLRGVGEMEESTTYQEIIEKGVTRGLVRGRVEGRVEGRVDGERHLLVRQGTAKFGPPDPATLAVINSIDDDQRFIDLAIRLLHVDGWKELVGG